MDKFRVDRLPIEGDSMPGSLSIEDIERLLSDISTGKDSGRALDRVTAMRALLDVRKGSRGQRFINEKECLMYLINAIAKYYGIDSYRLYAHIQQLLPGATSLKHRIESKNEVRKLKALDDDRERTLDEARMESERRAEEIEKAKERIRRYDRAYGRRRTRKKRKHKPKAKSPQNIPTTKDEAKEENTTTINGEMGNGEMGKEDKKEQNTTQPVELRGDGDGIVQGGEV